MAPFPPQPLSPLVSQSTSPPSSRAGSPHRTFSIRPPVPPPPVPVLAPVQTIDVLPAVTTPIPPPLPIEAIHPPNMLSCDSKINEEEVSLAFKI